MINRGIILLCLKTLVSNVSIQCTVIDMENLPDYIDSKFKKNLI